MSSDNGYQIQKHPNGGYAAVMYFASDEEIRPARQGDKQFPTPFAAFDWANDEYSEYGPSYDMETRAVVRKLWAND